MSKFGSPFKKNLTISFQGIINSRWLLYFVFLLAAVDLYVFAVNGELFYVALFVLIGILTAFFSKNMTVILFIAMILTNILRFGKDVRVKEGMEDGAGATKEDEGGDYQFLDKKEDDKKSAKRIPGSPPPLIETLVPVPKDTDETKVSLIDGSSPAPAAAASPTAAATATATTPTTEALTNDITSKMAGLDQDTVELLQKQQKLMENMENLKPLLSNAERILDKFRKPPAEGVDAAAAASEYMMQPQPQMV